MSLPCNVITKLVLQMPVRDPDNKHLGPNNNYHSGITVFAILNWIKAQKKSITWLRMPLERLKVCSSVFVYISRSHISINFCHSIMLLSQAFEKYSRPFQQLMPKSVHGHIASRWAWEDSFVNGHSWDIRFPYTTNLPGNMTWSAQINSQERVEINFCNHK